MSDEDARRVYMVGQPTGGLHDLHSVEHLPRVTMGLVHRGYSDSEITGILGGNFMRLFRKVWGE
jgi:microsomal dipeptidase-like Zn-dependent dipeptidase